MFIVFFVVYSFSEDSYSFTAFYIVSLFIDQVSNKEYRTFRTKDFSHKSFSTSFGTHVVTVLVVLITTVNFLLVNEFCEICGS